MIYDLQKASFLKRISAFLLDLILMLILMTGFAWATSALLNFSENADELDSVITSYEEQFDLNFSITNEEYEKMTEDERKYFNDSYYTVVKDERYIYLTNIIFYSLLTIVSVSLFLSHLILEFIVPLLFKNGQTVGKKIFGLGLMRTDGVRVSTLSLFARAILGKYTIETMVPVLLLVMTFFGIVGMMGPIVILLLLIFQIILVVTTNTNSMIHDTFGVTVVVDLASQKIFDSVEEMIEYKKRIHAEKVAKKDY